MESVTVDVAIIGAGSAGLNAKREAQRANKRWVMIDPGPYGTTCARVGCMPSKLLIAAADRAHEVQTAGILGVDVDPERWRVNGPAVFERVRRERDRFAGFVERDVEALDAEHLLRGLASFEDPHTLRVQLDSGDVRVKAETIVIATGSSPWIPPLFDAVREHVLVNDDVFELEDVPESVAVFGTGVIGLELGQALGRLGARVAFFNPFDLIGGFTDPVIKAKVREVWGESMTWHLGIDPESATRDEAGRFVLRWTDSGGEQHEETFSHVLCAAGRKPNVASLRLDRAGVELDRRGVPVFDEHTMQCGDSHIFIAGDVNNDRPLLHEASDEGRIAGFNAAHYPQISARPRRTPLAIAFTDPQMALVGRPFDSLDPDTIEVGEVSYDNQGRARVMGVNSGHVRIYATRKCCKLVGAELFGPRVEHMAHLLAWAIQQDMNVQTALSMPFYHPVVEEGIRTALRDLAKKLRQTGTCPPEDFAFGPGA